MKSGCYTALVSPFHKDGSIDHEGLDRLVEFQIQNNVTGILAVGTTGESPAFVWNEHNEIVEQVVKTAAGRCAVIAGQGSNNTQESLEGARHAVECGADAVLLVDPYYNGPSSLEIRREYYEPVANAFPDTEFIPYVIPGRTGAQLFPQDLAMLKDNCANVTSVKEATGNLDNMRLTRKCCGDDFTIFSGDDGLTHQMMSDPDIKAAGVISVMSNLIPGPVGQMVDKALAGGMQAAAALNETLAPLFSLVTVTTVESSPHGEVTCRSRNPVGIKTLMAVLGMPAGPCRQPLGKMTEKGIRKVLEATRKVWADDPSVLAPVAEFFGVDVEKRLNDPAVLKDLVYKAY